MPASGLCVNFIMRSFGKVKITVRTVISNFFRNSNGHSSYNTQLKKLFQEELSSGRIPPSVFRGYHLTVFICITKALITCVFVGFDKQ